MSDWIMHQSIQCPYCGEHFEIEIDTSAGADIDDLIYQNTQSASNAQKYIEDCYVCCRPIEINIHRDEESNAVSSFSKRLDD